jgi:hypothetical protein
MSRKYGTFRDRYAFSSVIQAVPLDGSAQGCDCCQCEQNDLFLTAFRVIERNFLSDESLNDTVNKRICSKCLHYVFKQPQLVYKTKKRQQMYRKKFKQLVDWCEVNNDICSLYPTTARFFQLCNDGEPFKPELVRHVTELIHLIQTPQIMTFSRILLQRPRTPELENLRFRVDSAKLTAVECQQIQQFLDVEKKCNLLIC